MKSFEDVDFQVYGFVLKILSQKSAITLTNGMMEVWKVIVLTSEQALVCIEVQDRGFILQSAFPKENSLIFLDNLKFVSCTMIDHKDLSFESFESTYTLN